MMYEEIELQLTKLDLAIKAARIGLWDMDVLQTDPIRNENIINWSNEFRSLMGYTDENDFPNVISSFHKCLHPEDYDRVTTAISAHIMDTTGKTPYNIEYRVIKKNNEVAYIRANGETIRDDNGNPIRVTGTAIDITDERNALINTEKLRVQAEEANKAKSAFLANMSHEIRTPLNAVIGLSDLILSTNDLSSENHYRLEQINNAGATLLGTVNDILDISKIESGKFELVPTGYDIPSMINDSVAQSILHRSDKPIEFILDIGENIPTRLYGDELRIKQILSNLLANAFKYTLKGFVKLEVTCTRTDDNIWLGFTVTDTGIGIREEDMENLFTDYVQLDTETNRKIIGTGLGLSITNRLAILMDGKVTAESEYGKGSVFSVQLLQKHITDTLIDPDVITSLKCLSYSAQKRRHVGALSLISLPYARVLLVDDVATNLDVAKGLMKPYHMQIDCVTGGFEAVEAMSDSRVHYNAIFMDHMMPGMDGIEATKKIREIGTDYAKNIPIIALTANAIVGNEEMFLNNGFQAFISKPIEISRLDSVIREWVRDKEQEKLYINDNREDIRQPAGDNAVDMLLYSKEISGMDIVKGLGRFSGDRDAYLDVLASFAGNTPALLESAREDAKSKTRLAEYETIAHGIKGSSRAIFADRVGDMAEALEKAARAGNYDYVVSSNKFFLETTWSLIRNIEELLKEVRQNDIKPKKDSPDRGVLKKLREACLNYDMNGVDEAVAELIKFSYEAGGELVEWLRINVEQANFDEIAEELEKKERENGKLS